MAAIDQLINIVITQDTTAVPTSSTTIPLIVGKTDTGWADGDVVHTYTDAGSMLTDGFTATSLEYVAALALTAQKVVPGTFLVGRRVVEQGAAQTMTLTIDFSATTSSYGLSIDALTYSVSGASALDVATKLSTAINQAPPSGLAASVDSNNNVTLTVGPNDTLTVANEQGLTAGSLTSEAEVDQSMAATLAAIQAQNNTWYGLLTPGANDADILAAAQWTEAQRKIYVAASATPAIGLATSKTDLASQLQAGSFSRTALVFSPLSAASGVDAAWMGNFLPLTPGSYNTAFMTLAGIQADTLSATQQATCIGNPQAGIQGKSANIYQKVSGVGVTQMGTMGSGQYIDLTVGIDGLFFALQAAMFDALVNNTKIPYTNRGVGILVAAVHGVLQAGIADGLIDGTQDYNVTAPSVTTVPKSLRAGRIAPTISFNCTVQGAVNAIRVAGQILI